MQQQYDNVKTIKYNEENDEYYLEFDDFELRELNWESGDTLEWINNDNGSFTIRKREKLTGDSFELVENKDGNLVIRSK